MGETSSIAIIVSAGKVSPPPSPSSASGTSMWTR